VHEEWVRLDVGGTGPDPATTRASISMARWIVDPAANARMGEAPLNDNVWLAWIDTLAGHPGPFHRRIEPA